MTSLPLHPHELARLQEHPRVEVWRVCQQQLSEGFTLRGEYGSLMACNEKTGEAVPYDFPSPFGAPGDRVELEIPCDLCGGRVKEVPYDPSTLLNREQYKAQLAGRYVCEACPGTRGKSGMRYFHKSEARIPATVLSVEPRQVQSVTEEEAVAAGVESMGLQHPMKPPGVTIQDASYKLGFAWIWNEHNPTHPYASNPHAWRAVLRRDG